MWYKNLTQKGDVKHNSNFSKRFFFLKIKAFFVSRMDKKGIAKNRSDFSKRRFFWSKKWKRK